MVRDAFRSRNTNIMVLSLWASNGVHYPIRTPRQDRARGACPPLTLATTSLAADHGQRDPRHAYRRSSYLLHPIPHPVGDPRLRSNNSLRGSEPKLSP